jgi:hypothetical protein
VTIEGNAPEQLSRRATRRAQFERLVHAIRDSDLATVDEMVLRLSRSRRWLAPLALIVGAFAMLFTGVKLLFTNWRLTLIQVLPAMWIWAAMYDLKLHVSPLHDKAFHILTGPALVIPLVLGIAAITAASFYLNAVFAYAIVGPGPPVIRSAFTRTRPHLAVVLGSGLAVGLLLGLSTVVVPRWGKYWFGFSLSIVVGLMMVCYVAVPARLIGMKTDYPKRDKLAASAVGGVIGAVVCTPPYVLGRVGLVLLNSHTLFALGVILFAVGLTLQAGATGAVKTVKMTAKLLPGAQPAGHSQAGEEAGRAGSPATDEDQGGRPAGRLPRCPWGPRRCGRNDMRRSVRRLVVLVAIIAIAFLAAGCGSSVSSAVGNLTSRAATATSAATPAATTPTPTATTPTPTASATPSVTVTQSVRPRRRPRPRAPPRRRGPAAACSGCGSCWAPWCSSA